MRETISVLKTILENCNGNMTEEIKKKVESLLDVYIALRKKNEEMDVENDCSVFDESDKEKESDSDSDSESEDEVEEEIRKQLQKDWEEECKRDYDDGDNGFDLADET